MSIGSAVIFKNGFKLEKVDESNTITVDVVSSTELLSEGQLEEYDYDTEYENIYKTNILLSQPLRSVGDVKDRLFRDSDGLWKVERNVGYEIITSSELRGYVASNGYAQMFKGFRVATPSSPVTSSKMRELAPEEWSYRTNWGVQIASSGNLAISIKEEWLESTGGMEAFTKWVTDNRIDIQYALKEPIIETLNQELQDKLNNIASYKVSNYIYTIVDKTNILPEYVRENLKPTLHATFKGGGWYTRFKTEQEFIKAQEQIGNKADTEVIDNLKNDLQDYAKTEDYRNEIGVVNSSLESYKSLLETIERDLKGERDENGEFILDVNGNPINMGAIKEIEDIVNRETAIVNNLGELSERWNFIGTNIIMASGGLLIGETGVDKNGKEIVITGIRIAKDRVDFVENKVIVAEITGSRMKINRAIFVQSISVGEHKIETLSGGHTTWTWVTTI